MPQLYQARAPGPASLTYRARVPQLLKPGRPRACAPRQATAVRNLRITAGESPRIARKTQHNPK